MRNLCLGRAFPAAFLMAILFVGAAAPAFAQDFAVEAPQVVEATTPGALIRDSGGFVLVEHGGWAPPPRLPADQIFSATEPAVPVARKPTIGQVRLPSLARDRVIVHIRAAELRHGLPSGLLDALVAAESNYHPYAVSSAGAAGLAQLMPATARSLGVLDRFDIRANLDGGARYLRSMIDKFGSISLALAAYNAGPGAVARAGGIPRNAETPGYVARVMGYWQSFWR